MYSVYWAGIKMLYCLFIDGGSCCPKSNQIKLYLSHALKTSVDLTV